MPSCHFEIRGKSSLISFQTLCELPLTLNKAEHHKIEIKYILNIIISSLSFLPMRNKPPFTFKTFRGNSQEIKTSITILHFKMPSKNGQM